MASDETTICNIALGKIGATRITALTDASQAARFCSLFYAQCRDEVLRMHAWNFAGDRATLSQLAAAPTFGWAVQYQLPTTCLRVLQLNGFEPTEQRSLFEIEQGRLLTDETTAQITFTARVTDCNLYDPLFIKALAVKLASELAMPLTGSRSQGIELLKEYEGVMRGVATAMDSREGRAKRKPAWVESDLINSRFASDIV